MTYPYFTKGLNQGKSCRADKIDTLERQKIERPQDYIPHKELTDAVNVALALGMPLLLTGKPGTGKTQLAYTLAHELKAKPLLKFETKSTSQARDLFYTFDALNSFKMKNVTDQRHFIHYQALGQAILEAFPAKAVKKLLPPAPKSEKKGKTAHNGPRRAVVLIDEIDKAPRDFPNDLLNEIDRLYFRVPELNNQASPGADDENKGIPSCYRPIIIMTSNSEKGLPDAFLRRCIYYDIPFPDPRQMQQIISTRLGGISTQKPMLKDALRIFYKLRQDHRLNKDPSTAELLNWLQILIVRNADPELPLVSQPDLVLETLSTLVKTKSDYKDAKEIVQKALGMATD